MTRDEFLKIEDYMLGCMKEGKHESGHIYRVLYYAMDIARSEGGADWDVLIAACLLHDAGRPEELYNANVSHAEAGSEKAFDFLVKLGWTIKAAGRVKRCIAQHSLKGGGEPDSLEAKILFDADKVDAAGAIGCARSVYYLGQELLELYSVRDGKVLDGAGSEPPSFFHKYWTKIDKLSEKLYTHRGVELARERERAARRFYEDMLSEARGCFSGGAEILKGRLVQGL